MNVNPGELNKRIEIVRPQREQDADGYYTETMETVHSCWAKFTRLSGREVADRNADYGIVEARFLIRYTAKEITRKMLVRYAGALYEIKYSNEYGDAHAYIELITERKTLEAKV